MTVIFQSHHQFEFCDRILRGLEEDDGDSLMVATSSQEVSLASLKMLQLFSPLVRDIVMTFPSSTSPLTLILPDTDANSWKCLMELLTSGNVDVHPLADEDVECQKEKISALARCLRINLESRQVTEESRLRLRVKRPEELLEEGSTSSIASSQENNIVSNDYDSDLEDFPVPSKSDLSDLDHCESLTGSSLASSFNTLPESDENFPEEVMVDDPDMTEEPVLKVRRKVILTWKKNDASEYVETSSDKNGCHSKTPDEVIMSNLDDHSSQTPNKEGEINYPPKGVKLTYANWKERREALKLKRKTEKENNSWSCYHYKCKMKFKSLEEKTNHEKVHKLECSNCSKSFISEKSLSAHFKAVHNKPVDSSKPECPRCSKVFKTKEGLFAHFHAAHTKDPTPFECVVCPSNSRPKYPYKAALSLHLESAHSLRITKDCYVNSAIYEYETMFMK